MFTIRSVSKYEFFKIVIGFNCNHYVTRLFRMISIQICNGIYDILIWAHLQCVSYCELRFLYRVTKQLHYHDLAASSHTKARHIKPILKNKFGIVFKTYLKEIQKKQILFVNFLF